MKFATDIVKIDRSKKTFLPPDNEDYPIFEEEVYCPMAGSVIKVENGIEDNIPYSGNYPYNTGNMVVIKNNNYYFLIGHLKKGSIRVKLGDFVQQNDLIAKAGNSGYSERPHIHMQLISSQTDNYWKGLGVNISFQSKNLYKNRQMKT
jgi:murein DD-endopeptidase MepM/ murein hydrolase activator NlpD